MYPMDVTIPNNYYSDEGSMKDSMGDSSLRLPVSHSQNELQSDIKDPVN